MAANNDLIKKRTKELAIIKASNELLEDVKKGLLEREGVDEGVILQLDTAQKENLMMARNTYGASEQEVNEMEYHAPSANEIKIYEKRLELKGLTDEQLHQKDISANTASTGTKKKTTRKRAKASDENNTSTEEKVEKPRRKRRTKKETETKDETTETLKEIVNEAAKKEKVEVAQTEPVFIEKKKKNTSADYNIEDYDLSSIPSYVQYDIIPLPSKGQCYPHKKSRIPVAYLTAADENIFMSPNMYRDGKVGDVILRRKILDKDINIDELCVGDRDAILIWLRATSYGDDFPIFATHPDTGKQYNTSIKLSDLKYKNFNLEGDEDGLFDYTTSNGDKIKIKFLTISATNKLRDNMTSQTVDKNKYDIIMKCGEIKNMLSRIGDVDDESKEMLTEDIEEIVEIVGEDMNIQQGDIIPEFITEQMVTYTYSVNGIRDKEYIKKYIENMRVVEARKYRDFYNENRPGVDLNITVNIPESDGGGSFETFLRIEDTIFVNY